MRRMRPPVSPTVRAVPHAALRLVAWLFVATLLAPELLENPRGLVDFHDEFYFFSHEEAARKTLVEHGQLPFWNPYHCGGIVGVANPQDTSLGLDFLLRVLFGTAAGRSLAVLLFFTLGMEGLYRLARLHRASITGAAIGAVVWGVSGRLQNAVEHGHLNLLLFAMMPWALWCFERALRERAYVLGGGFVIAWMFLSGGTYTVPYTVQILLVGAVYWSGRIALSRDSRVRGLSAWKPWLVLAGIGAVSMALCAIRLVPLADVVLGMPREVMSRQVAPADRLLSALFSESGAGYVGDAYVGVVIGAFAGLALLSGDRSGRWFAGAALFFFALALGEQHELAPYALFAKLPVFEQLRDPYRYVAVVGMFLCLAASRGFTLVQGLPEKLLRLRRRRSGGPPHALAAHRAAAALGWLAASSIAAAGAEDFVESQTVEVGTLSGVAEPPPYDQPFRQSRGNRWDEHVWPAIDRGTLACFEETRFPQSARLRGDLEAEEYPLDPETASVRRVRWSPNEIVLRVDALRDARVVVNQNFHPGWTASVGTVVRHEGLLAVDVPAGQHELALRFADPAALVGAAVSGLAWLALLGLLGRAAWRRGRRWREAWRRLPW
jgi:hypothetical protein